MSATIVSAAKELFQKKGYSDTKIADIIKAAKVTKAEFDKCYNSKQDVCSDVLKLYKNDLKSRFKTYDENDNMRQRLSMFLDAYFEDAENIAANGCPIFNLYYDLRSVKGELSKSVNEILEMQHQWIDEQFVIMLKSQSGTDQGDRLMSAVSGLILLAKLTNDPAMFKVQIIQLRSWIRSM
ncbi:MAG: TetR/AcrR family transcriptional regulator [Kordiimonadaceae bacterium]|jgi:AcrR family transcriptional regulator|nr:TetR/AcrR family transcriptional regulator [Kordiimonadaceae bacterium]MBT6036666.1 TetR/AcrR family transcriptional regulator [Kordiimonadaceae bacterium]MBT6330330.1 TetR/AcrR family transcriptional regulator [Kordiimonadaceae bacterium]MBT7581736.1 TetR/AcrR family transcriptional regulator [Kordiimonadaceae bacterium]